MPIVKRQLKLRANRLRFEAALTVGILITLVACGRATLSPTPPLAPELVFYNWADYMPQSVLDAFTAEFGVRVTYHTYETMDEAVQNIKSGAVFDVAIVEHDLIPELVAAQLLAEIDHHHLPNLKNIPADFRDLTFDPDDKHSVPYSWGTTGLLVRTDLVASPITRWADLWDVAEAGKIAVRPEPVELIGVALKSLGYPLNSENPQQLEAALQRLLALQPSLLYVSSQDDEAVGALLSGQAAILLGWPGDALYAQEQSDKIQYILPEDGTLLWGDRFIVSAASPNAYTAEVFLNFLLRPEVAGQIVNENHYLIANEAAHSFVNPEILNNPIIFPSNATIKKADWYLPLSPAGQELYDAIWERFLKEP